MGDEFNAGVEGGETDGLATESNEFGREAREKDDVLPRVEDKAGEASFLRLFRGKSVGTSFLRIVFKEKSEGTSFLRIVF